MSLPQNTVVLAGRLTKNPDLKRMARSSRMVCTFSIAVKRYRKSAYTTDFFDLTAFDRIAETIHAYFIKGRPIYVVGRLAQHKTYSRKWKRHMKRVVVEVVNFGFSMHDDDSKERPLTKAQVAAAELEAYEHSDTIKAEDIPFDFD